MLVSRTAATGAAGAWRSASQHQGVGAEGGQARHDVSRRRATRARPRRPARATATAIVERRARREHEPQVGQRVGVAQAVAVDERVAGDRARGRRARGASAARGRPRPRAPRCTATIPAPTTSTPATCGAPDRAADPGQAGDQDEHRRGAARHRVDGAQLAAPVGGREQQVVAGLERGGRGHVRPRAGVHGAGQRGDRRPRDDADGERRGRRRPRVAGAGQQQVPERVQDRGAEREASAAPLTPPRPPRRAAGRRRRSARRCAGRARPPARRRRRGCARGTARACARRRRARRGRCPARRRPMSPSRCRRGASTAARASQAVVDDADDRLQDRRADPVGAGAAEHELDRAARRSPSTTVGAIIDGIRRPGGAVKNPSGLRSSSPMMLLRWMPVPGTTSPRALAVGARHRAGPARRRPGPRRASSSPAAQPGTSRNPARPGLRRTPASRVCAAAIARRGRRRGGRRRRSASSRASASASSVPPADGGGLVSTVRPR